MDVDSDDLVELIPLTTDQRIAKAVEQLPVLTAGQIPLEDSCPICLIPFPAILEDVSWQKTSEGPLPPSTCVRGFVGNTGPVHLGGVTRLAGCGHVFCRLE